MDFQEKYKLFKEFENYIEDSGEQKQGDENLANFDVNYFNQGILTREPKRSRSRKYDKEQIRRFQSNPEIYERQLREVSNYLYDNFQEYKNLVNYCANMLTFDYILIPDNLLVKEEREDKLVDDFKRMLMFVEDYNIKAKLKDIIVKLVRDDVYFGYELTDGDKFVWRNLPTNYCRLLGVDEFECLTFEFDFSYFDKKNVNIENFPDEFKNKHNNYKNNKGKRWEKIDPQKGICFKLDKSTLYALPFFTGIFDDIISLDEYKDIEKDSTEANNYKLIHQRIPMRDDKDTTKQDQFLLNHETAKKFHNNAKSNVGQGIAVITTPMDVEAINLQQNQIEQDIVSKSQRNVFTTAGVSQLLFNSDRGGASLNKSLTYSSGNMFGLLRQFELFFKKRLRMYSKNKSAFKWVLNFPDITIYNKQEMFDRLLKSAQFGFSKFFVLASLGYSQAQFMSINKLEDKLDLTNSMTPLVSSHTQSGDAGRPQKGDDEISESTESVRDND